MKARFIAADGHIADYTGDLDTIAKAYRRHVGSSCTCVSDDGLVRAELQGCTIADIDSEIPPVYTAHYYPDMPGAMGLDTIAKLKAQGCTIVETRNGKTLSGYPIVYVRYTEPQA